MDNRKSQKEMLEFQSYLVRRLAEGTSNLSIEEVVKEFRAHQLEAKRLNDDSECFTPDMHSASTLLRHEIYLYSEHFLDQINDAISRRNGNITFANGLPVDEKKYDKNVWLKGISHIPDNSIKLRYIDWAKILDAWNPIVKQWADSSIDIPECSRNDKYLSAKYRRIEERRSLTLEYVNKHRNTENLFANLIKLEEVTPLT